MLDFAGKRELSNQLSPRYAIVRSSMVSIVHAITANNARQAIT